MIRHNASARSRKWVSGFTLIEILVVVVILAVLAAVVVPNVIKKIGEGRISAATSDITNFSTAIQLYQADASHVPPTDAGLNSLLSNTANEKNWKGPYLHNQAQIPNDPWGHPYKYVTPGPDGQEYLIISDGDGSGPITSATIKAK